MIDEKDLGLSEEEVRELVNGAQKFLAPEPDPLDEERLTDRERPALLNYGTDNQ